MKAFVEAIWAVRLVTAVEAVRRKRKADVRLWVGLEVGCIADPGGEMGSGRIAGAHYHLVVGCRASHRSPCYRLGYFANARLLACFYEWKPHSSSSTSSSLKSSSSSSISIFGTSSPSSVCSVSATLAVSNPSIRSFAFFSC